MSVHTSELAPATRVASRKLGPTLGRGSPSPRAPAACTTSTLASTWGRWDTAASSRSWVAASMATGRAPKLTTRRCRRSYSRPEERSCGVRYQTAPWNRSARACSTPLVSAPATGWPPTKRSSATASTRARLVEPTSLTTQSGPAAARASPTCSGSAPTGAQAKHASAPSSASWSEPAAPSIAPSSRARSRRSRLRPKPTTSAPSTCLRAASPIEPPIRPTPRTAILKGSACCPALAHGPGELVEHAESGVPGHAGVGDRLAVDEVAPVAKPLPALGDERLQHHAHDRRVAARYLAAHVGSHRGLTAVVLGAVVVGGVDHQALGQSRRPQAGQ